MNGRQPHRVALAVCMAGMFAAVARALDPSLTLLSWDFEGHLLRARMFLSDMAGARALTSWFPYWHGGFPMTEVYPPLATGLLGLFTVTGAAEWGGRLLLVALWIGSVPASYLFLRRFGLFPWPAALAACLVGTLDAPRTFGVQAIFWLGLIPNALGFLLAILTLAQARSLFGGPANLRRMALTALLGGLTILAHPFCAYWLAVAGTLLFLCESIGRDGFAARLRIAALTAAGAAAVGAFYWAPFLAGRENLLVTDPFSGADVNDLWRSLATMKNAGGPLALALAAAGFGALAVPARRRELAFFLSAAVATFAMSTGLIPVGGSLFGPSQAGRFEGFFLWLMLMSAGFGFEAALNTTSPKVRSLASTVVGVLVFLLVAGGITRQRAFAVAIPFPITGEVSRLAAEISSRLRPGDAVLTENDRRPLRMTGSPHVLNQRLPAEVPFYTDAGGGLPEGTAGALPMFSLSRDLSKLVPESRESLRSHGVRFIATIRADSADALAEIPWLKPVWSSDPGPQDLGLALFEVDGPAGRLGFPSDLAGNVSTLSYAPDGGYHIVFSSPTRVDFPLETAISFHPWLSAETDGRPVSTAAAPDGRLVLMGETGPVETLWIRYSPPAWISVVRIFSIFCFLGLFSLVVARRRAYP